MFYIEAHVGGGRKRWSLGTRDRIVADTLRRQVELDMISGGRLRVKTWEEFEQEFLSWIEPQVRARTSTIYRFVVKKFSQFIGNEHIRDVRDISPDVISRFTDARRRDRHPTRHRTISEGGIKFDLRVLHRLFGYAVACEYITKNPVIARNINSTPGKTMPFTQQEIDAMLADEDVRKKPYLEALILTFLHTGLRIGDVRELRADAVHGDRLLLRTRKRSRDVSIHLHGELKRALDAHVCGLNALQRKSGLLFPTDRGTLNLNLDKALYRVFRRAKITGGHAHRFRDTFAVRLLSKGASLYDVAKLLGISVQTAERHYAPWVEELQIRAASLVKRLDFLEKTGTD